MPVTVGEHLGGGVAADAEVRAPDPTMAYLILGGCFKRGPDTVAAKTSTTTARHRL